MEYKYVCSQRRRRVLSPTNRGRERSSPHRLSDALSINHSLLMPTTTPKRRERWNQSVNQPFDHDVGFSPEKNEVKDAPDYDRRTMYKIESDTARKQRINLLRLGIVVSALGYGAAMSGQLSLSLEIVAFLKAVPIFLLLALVMLLGDMKPYANRMALGLMFCAVGDVCLELDGGGRTVLPFFFIGLASFFVGHCCYTLAFATNRIDLTVLKVVPAMIYCASIFLVLRPSLPADLYFPVLAYALAIGLMCVFGLCRQPAGHAPLWSSRCSAVGAIVFCASDTILAYNRFVAPIPHAKYSIMFTYYLAQYILVMSARGAMARPLTKALGSVENFFKTK